MFLFTNAPVGTRESAVGARVATGVTQTGTTNAVTTASAANTANGPVIAAIRDGAATSGVGFDYLLATAQRESALNPSAKAATSSATGLFQFIEQTWLGVMKNAGGKLGLSSYSDAITARSDGSYSVADPATRQSIFDLRRDPRVSAAMAGALTQRNREALSSALGREPTSGDLYAAHVLGALGAAKLISTAQASPTRAAALDMPEAAAANRSLFYDRAGQPRSASALYALLSTSTAGGKPAVAATSSLPEVALPEVTTAYASLEGGIRSLFQTDRRQGGVSESVAKLWQNRSAAAEAAPRGGPTYFPRSETVEPDAAVTGALAARETAPEPAAEPPSTPTALLATDAKSLLAADVKPILVPLPPGRPTEFAPLAEAVTGRNAGLKAVEGDGRALGFSTLSLRNGS